jgi:hypothetical protein
MSSIDWIGTVAGHDVGVIRRPQRQHPEPVELGLEMPALEQLPHQLGRRDAVLGQPRQLDHLRAREDGRGVAGQAEGHVDGALLHLANQLGRAAAELHGRIERERDLAAGLLGDRGRERLEDLGEDDVVGADEGMQPQLGLRLRRRGRQQAHGRRRLQGCRHRACQVHLVLPPLRPSVRAAGQVVFRPRLPDRPWKHKAMLGSPVIGMPGGS